MAKADPYTKKQKEIFRREWEQVGGTAPEIAERLSADPLFGRKISSGSASSMASKWRFKKPERDKRSPAKRAADEAKKRAGYGEVTSGTVPEGAEYGKVYKTPEVESDVKPNKAGTITTRSLTIQSPEQALATSGVDPDEWVVERAKVNYWDVTISGHRSSTETDQTYTNYQISLWLRPKSPLTLGMEAVVEKLLVAPPRNTIPKPAIHVRRKVLAVVGLTDQHFGLYAYGRECGRDFDLDICSRLYTGGMEESIASAKDRGVVSKIALPIGSDLFHAEQVRGLTTKHGNVLDMDTRFSAVIDATVEAVVEAVEYALMKVPEVELFYLPGNHDQYAAYWMTKVLKAHFRKTKRLIVDDRPKSRKYLPWGVCLTMFAHGCSEREQLPIIMCTDEPAMFGAARVHEVLLGHRHKKAAQKYMTVDTRGRITIRTLPSLVERDAYHYEAGWGGGWNTCETYLYDAEHGYAGHVSVNGRTLFKDHDGPYGKGAV